MAIYHKFDPGPSPDEWKAAQVGWTAYTPPALPGAEDATTR